MKARRSRRAKVAILQASELQLVDRRAVAMRLEK